MKLVQILFVAFLGFALYSCGETFDCDTLELNIGDTCDDGDANTENDVVSADCVCAGTDIVVAVSLTYTDDVLPILNMSCGTSVNPCHSATSTSTFPMSTYAETSVQVGVGRIIGAINHTAGFSRMPKNLDKLSDADIAIITDWINAGAPE